MSTQEIINQIIKENTEKIGYKAARKQYPAGKAQIVTLSELGIINLMPKGFGHSDAAAVIAEANRVKTAVFNAYGEGEVVPASDLNIAIRKPIYTNGWMVWGRS